jgi:hypothetical protein
VGLTVGVRWGPVETAVNGTVVAPPVRRTVAVVAGAVRGPPFMRGLSAAQAGDGLGPRQTTIL